MLSDSFTTNDFIDMNTYCYYPKDGQMRLRGVVLGLGWENRPLTPGKLSCYHKKGENKMARPKREAPLKAKLLALFEEHEGKIEPIRKELNCTWLAAKRWLVEAEIIDSLGQPTSEYNFEWYAPKKKQTPTLEPEELGGENRNEGEGEPAAAIIPKDDSFHIISGVTPASLGLTDNTTELQDKEMAESDTGPKSGIAIQLLLDVEERAKHQMLLNMPPKEKELLETTLNAYFAVKRVLNNPVALAQMNQVLETGVV
jgi:hypothetical protein